MVLDKNSRLIIKNLPKHLDEKRLKEIFEKFGKVTDSKIIKNKDNKSRLFGFVGYKDESSSINAKEYFDNTFIDTSRIKVEFALRPSECPKAWSKYSKHRIEKNKVQNKNKDKQLDKDEEFQKFMDSVKPKKRKTPNLEVDKTENEINLRNKIPKNEKQKTETEKNTEDSTRSKEEIIGNRIRVLNIPYSSTEEEISRFFSKFGQVEEVHIPLDSLKRSIGYCFVRFKDPLVVRAILTENDKQHFQGRLLRIEVAREINKMHQDSQAQSYSKLKEAEKQKSAMDPKDYFKSLFMRQDTVVDAISQKLNISKREFFNDEDRKKANAVKLALSEAHLIKETKNFFVKNGINELVFENDSEDTKQKSNRVFFVKNLPFSTLTSDLREVFSKFGELEKVLISPSKSTAIISFVESSNAKLAFKKSAYRKFKYVPLYLEWAPKNIFVSDSNNSPVQHEIEKNAKEIKNNNEKALDYNTSADVESDTLYIKNLNFETTEKNLRRLLETAGSVKHVSIKSKTVNDERRSLGYGFAMFGSIKEASAALTQLNGALIDGHELKMSFSRSKSSKGTKQTTSGNQSGTQCKVVVKNLPFEATSKDIRDLFGEFGQIKACRMPSKIKGHRGFAFVEFAMHSEALNAIQSLCNAHLYGRRLVIQWAKE